MASAYRRIAGWPEDTITPGSGKRRFTQLLTNILFLVLVSLLFVYASLIPRSDNIPSSNLRVRQLDELSRYGPTVFPILFTIVVGGTLRSLALYRLQAGGKIGFLDLLLGSTTLGNTIETLFERRFNYFDVTSLGLLLLWALSPLGGQATLRVIGYQDVTMTRQLELPYLDYSRSIFPNGLILSDFGTIPITLTSAFLSSLSSPVSLQLSTSDLWGNVKTPVLESLPGYESVGPGE
ncbi:hypothetical protein O1611_g83 [Lasiodiplodia mahajangana]|uniref:Uncharacterized protein n=1 Tax=Lasiodiplodia mahajangana TaxID=1108764 RepID=A0ACC2K1J3_9PEZI|nr:hypothetical protein O1611_g83 [Lasiodiplodia mahajangana]